MGELRKKKGAGIALDYNLLITKIEVRLKKQ